MLKNINTRKIHFFISLFYIINKIHDNNFIKLLDKNSK